MIDFYIKINRKEKKILKPSECLSYYQKYACVENESTLGQVYYYTNSFFEMEHSESLFENEQYFFFLFGKVFYRNNIEGAESKKDLPAKKVYEIVNNNLRHYEIIKGNYAYILVKKNNYSVVIVNSPFGVLPINYAVQDGFVYISSNLTMILEQLTIKTVNKAALVQISMFDTILGNNTLIKEIKQLQYGRLITINGLKVDEDVYFNHSNLLGKKPLQRKDVIYDITQTLRDNAALLPTDKPFLMGLTGGYDCRLNFALINEKNYKNIKAYTYGMSISPEIKIAKLIAKKYNLSHEIIILEEEFEKDYVSNADEVLKLGDGFTPFMRVNYYYAHRYLSKFSRECITGMYGSEFIKPMHVMEDSVTINPQTVNAFYSENIVEALTQYFHKIKNSQDSYFTQEVFCDTAWEETLELIRANYITDKESLTKEERIFNFYLNEGMRKFFMELIRVDKMFVNHSLPYLDLDFLELLLKTKYAGVYNHIFNESLIKRRKGQLLYADTLAKLNPELNNIPVDRGYKPKYLRSNLGWLFVSVGYVFGKKLRKLIKGNTTFNTKKWSSMVYEENIDILSQKHSFFNDNLMERYRAGYHLKNEHVFGKHFSVKKWLSINNLLK